MTEPQRRRGVIKVKLLRGDKILRSYKVRSDTFTIGSAKGCTIRAAGDPAVAPKHATLYIEDEELILVPEPGAQVYLNGEEVDFAVPAPDDIIKIGRLNVQVTLVESMESMAPGQISKADVQAAAAAHLKARQAKQVAAQQAAAQQAAAQKAAQQQAAAQKATAQKAAQQAAAQQAAAQRAAAQAAAQQAAAEQAAAKRAAAQQAAAHKAAAKRAAAQQAAAQQAAAQQAAAQQKARPAVTLPPLQPAVGKTIASRKRSGEAPSPIPIEISDEQIPVSASQPLQGAEEAVSAPQGLAEDNEDTLTSVPPFDILEDERAPLESAGLGDFSDEEANYYLSDDEEDEESFAESFDLANMLLEGTKTPEANEGPKENYCAAHVIRVKNGSVVETFGVEPESFYANQYDEVECCIEDKKGKAEVENIILSTARHISGIVYVKGEKRALNPSEGTGMVSMVLRDGDAANLTGEGGEYKIEVYRPPLAPKKVPFFSMSPKMIATVVLIALALHAAAAYSLRYFDFATLDDFLEPEAEVYAEVKLKEPEQKKIEEIQPEDLPPEKQDAKAIAERAPKVSRRQVKKVKEQQEQKTAVNNLLNILSRGSGKSGKSNKLKDLISNIDAVAGPGTSSFSIAGAIASLPGKDVNIAKSGGGGIISTLSSDQVGGSAIASVGKVKKKGKVRGKVTKMSSGVKVGGSLSREDVLKVINKNFHAVQACYERALMQKPNLSGRIAFDWTVSTSGSVKGVRVRSSTLGNPQVANCIAGLIKRWKFPRPKGGEAVITFPFLFRVGS